MRVLRTVQSTLRSVNLFIHLRILYPAKRWLTLQHCAAMLMILYGIALALNPPPSFTDTAEDLHFPGFTLLVAALFFFFAARLIAEPRSEVGFRVATLPMFLYFFVIAGYTLRTHATPTGAITAFGVWALFQIAGTSLPQKRDGNDTGAN